MGRPDLISIGMPVFNGGECLVGTIASLLAQDEPHLELIISDNASTDDTEAICREFASRDRRVRYYRQPVNTGMGPNWNFVCQKATGTYFIWAAHDDLWSPNLLSSTRKALEEEPGAVLAFPRNFFVNERREVVIDCSSLADLAGPLPLLQRLNHVLWFEEGAQKGNLVHGLIRTDAVQRMPYPTLATSGYGVWGGDQLIVFSLACEGYFVHVPEAQFFKRYYPARKYDADDLLEHVHEMQGYFSRYRQIIERSPLAPLARDILLTSLALRESAWYSRVLCAQGLEQARARLGTMIEHCDEVIAGKPKRGAVRAAASSDPLTSIVILNFNGRDHLPACLDSIQRHTSTRHEVIVFDNASTDGSREYLRTVPGLTLVESPINLGCPPGRTQAVTLAQGDFVVFLDNDTMVTPGWLDSFLSHMRADPGIGILGPRSNHVSGAQRVQQPVTYTNVYELAQFAKLWTWLARRQPTRIPVHRLVGFCMCVRRAVIDRIGAPDPQFGKFGFEDDDYTLRALVAGFQAMIANDVFIHHTGGPQSQGDPEYNRQMLEAWGIFRRKWGIPEGISCGEGYDVERITSQPFDPARHYVPLPPASTVKALVYHPRRDTRRTLPVGSAAAGAATVADVLPAG